MKSKIYLFSFLLVFIPALANANQAGVVARGSDGVEKTACVTFNEDSITGYELLQRANFDPILDKGFLVSINNERAKAAGEAGAGDDYWSYWQASNSKWYYARLGATSNPVKNGQLDGWQRGGSNPLLTSRDFASVCPPTQTSPTTTTTGQDTPKTETTSQATPSPDTTSQKSNSDGSTTSKQTVTVKPVAKPEVKGVSIGKNSQPLANTSNEITPNKNLPKPVRVIAAETVHKINFLVLFGIFALCALITSLVLFGITKLNNAKKDNLAQKTGL